MGLAASLIITKTFQNVKQRLQNSMADLWWMLLLRSYRFYRFAVSSDTKKIALCPHRDCKCSELKLSSSFKKGERRKREGGENINRKVFLRDFFIK